jgi:hypothetical protein
VTEALLFLLVVGNYGLGVRRDGLPVGRLVGAAAVVYWAVRLGGGFAFAAVGAHVGRHPTLMSDATMMAVAPFAALCAYAVVRLLERPLLERPAASATAGAAAESTCATEGEAAPSTSATEEAAAEPATATDAVAAKSASSTDAGAAESAGAGRDAAASPASAARDVAAPPTTPLLPIARVERRRLSRREELVLTTGLAVAGAIVFGHGLATAGAFWRDDLGADERAGLRRRAEEAARLEGRLLDCARPPSARDREAYRRVLDDLARAGHLRLSATPAPPAEILANLDRERAARCR